MKTRQGAAPGLTAEAHAAQPGLWQLGLCPESEALYRAVLRRPGLALDDLCAQFAMGAETARSLLQSLQARGLLVKDVNPAGWQAVPPEVAIEILLLEKQSELDDARRLAADLRRDMAGDGAPRTSMVVEVIPADPQSQFEAHAELWKHARKRVLNVMRPPFAVGGTHVGDMHSAASSRGVTVCHLLSLDMLSWPGARAICAQAIAQGVQIRTLERLLTRMTIADEDVGILPLNANDPASPLLRIRKSGVLDVLLAFAQAQWQRATPVLALPSADEDAGETPDAEAAIQELVTILAAGCNDKTAADLLGISQRTLTRRIGLLSEQLHAKSRFQCGWLAARLFDG